MDKTRPIFVLDYVDTSFDEVCERLDTWSPRQLTVAGLRQAIGHAGPIDRIADHVVRVPILDDDQLPVGELRVIAVSTGRDPLTELLVVMRPPSGTAAVRAQVLDRARSILDSATRQLETSADRALPRRAS